LALSGIFYIFKAKFKEMDHIIGRKKETDLLESLLKSEKSEFVAVYGRRRVGKTYLIRKVFKDRFTFQVTGMANATTRQQLMNFHFALQKMEHKTNIAVPPNWFISFVWLADLIERSEDAKKIIFIDELPWFDTPGSGFVQALEHFWNSCISARNDTILIVCGSAASWMINKLINNKGGLHNRVTKRLKIIPFTLAECELYLQAKNAVIDRYQIVQLYMILGGIPFYWDEVNTVHSAFQNIDRICFQENGLLRNEFNVLYRSLFSHSGKHERIIEVLSQKVKGLSRDEIISAAGLPNAGSTTRLLQELEESGFIRKYVAFGKKQRNSLYQLADFYSLFYLRFMKNTSPESPDNWINWIDHPKYRVWSGYAFEQVCLSHLKQIKKALGISGIQTSVSSWRSTTISPGAQIDLVIDRRDQVINLCEMKFSVNLFQIDKSYSDDLERKISTFRKETATRKSIFLTMITTFGLQAGSHSARWVQNDLNMDVLFENANDNF
jgi:AAA+ ATPase superfamily predicted ATPase